MFETHVQIANLCETWKIFQLVVEVFLDGVAITADCSLLQTPERGTHEL
jgi:hypothetical protein